MAATMREYFALQAALLAAPPGTPAHAGAASAIARLRENMRGDPRGGQVPAQVPAERSVGTTAPSPDHDGRHGRHNPRSATQSPSSPARKSTPYSRQFGSPGPAYLAANHAARAEPGGDGADLTVGFPEAAEDAVSAALVDWAADWFAHDSPCAAGLPRCGAAGTLGRFIAEALLIAAGSAVHLALDAEASFIVDLAGD